MQNLSIIIVTSNREQLLKVLLEQIHEFDQSLEIIVINNSEKVLTLKQKNIKLIHETFPSPGQARNRGLEHAKGDWVLFLDDDVLLPKNYFERVFNFFKENSNQYEIIGGPDQTPPNASLFATSLGLCLTSPMATANTRLRHSREKREVSSGDEKNLILCNLWVKRSFLLENDLKFNKKFFRNEENVLISEAINLGAKAIYIPDFFVYHYRKSHLIPLIKATFSSGKHRVRSFYFSKRLFSPLFLVPCLWVLYLMLLNLLLSYSKLFLIPVIAYFLLSLFFSIKIAQGNPLKTALILFYQVVINFFYGLGVFYGFFSNRLNVSRCL